MSDDKPDAATKKPRATRSTTPPPAEDPTPADVPVDAEESTAEESTEVAETTAEPEPVLATSDPAAVETAEPAEATDPVKSSQQIVYVPTPVAPRAKGNRGIGAIYAVVSALVFAALLAGATAIIGVTRGAALSFEFLTEARFYIPVLFFAIGFVLLVLILNRAAWWTYVLGSLFLAVFVYFGTIGVALLGNGIILNTPSEAAEQYSRALRDPFIIAAALLAREVSLWVGAIIASRGRKVKTRNAEARATYEREVAEKRAEDERRAASSAAAG